MKNENSIKVFLACLLMMSAILACNQFATSPTITPEPPTIEITSTIIPKETVDVNAGSSGLGDSLYPNFGNGGYDVAHYTLDITVNDIATSDLTAIVTIEAKATQTLGRFNLDFIGFEIDEITVNGETAEFSRKGQELTIHTLKPLVENETFTVVILLFDDSVGRS